MTAPQSYTSEMIRSALIAAGYSPELAHGFLADVTEWRLAWLAFQQRAYRCWKAGERKGGMKLINDLRDDPQLAKVKGFKLNNNWQPYFCVMFNDKFKVAYFEQRLKCNKSGHGIAEEAA